MKKLGICWILFFGFFVISSFAQSRNDAQQIVGTWIFEESLTTENNLYNIVETLTIEHGTDGNFYYILIGERTSLIGPFLGWGERGTIRISEYIIELSKKEEYSFWTDEWTEVMNEINSYRFSVVNNDVLDVLILEGDEGKRLFYRNIEQQNFDQYCELFLERAGQMIEMIEQENILQQYQLFIERVGQMNASLFPPDRFTWNNASETLTFTSRILDFTGTDWGFVNSPITFYKEMEVRFQGRDIVGAQWRYVYISADSWFQLGRPSREHPIISNWYTTAVSNNNVAGTGINGVINTLVHFENLRVNSTYRFRRGGGSNTTLTVKAITNR